MVETHEAERRRIACDIHDDSIQAMVAVSMRLQLLAPTLPAGQQKTVAALNRSVDNAVARLRNLVMRLRPPALDNHGLVDALAWYLGQVASEWHMRHRFHHDLEREPPTDTAVMVFRLTQDVLTCVHQHAQATEAELTVTSREDGLLVVVRDNGANAIDQDGEPVGLLVGRERAEAVGGWLRVGRAPGQGTTIQFWVPVVNGHDSEGERS